MSHKSRQITTPNNDTLYSDFWLDLRRGPARIRIPGPGERYFSLMMLDYYTNNFCVPGTRTTGTEPVEFTLVGPESSTEGLTGEVVRAPTNMVFALARILVDGPEDLEAAHAVQDAIELEAPEHDNVEGDWILRDAPWDAFFAEANRLIRINRPPLTDLNLLRRIAPLGIGPDQTFDPTAFTAEEAEAIASGVRLAAERLARIQTSMAKGGRGWVWPRRNLGVYGQDYFMRAVVAVGGLGALPLEEASYLRTGGERDQPLDGRRLWRMRFPPGGELPCDAFWSLSMYEPTPDGEFFFVRNELDRFSIGDRTPGLKRNADGSLDIWISADNPGPEREANWLPAPPGPFHLFLRAYLPRTELLEKHVAVPHPEPYQQ
ncbi:DUF1254 domain-containing protein [Rhizobium sp. L1K21]|nr:DUF1254 domain-containing protein [Rhizobium sp. L1K21]